MYHEDNFIHVRIEDESQQLVLKKASTGFGFLPWMAVVGVVLRR
jgi:hypothetical protein